MSEVEAPKGCVPLSAAIGALRDELTRAWWDGRDRTVRFKPSPVELTLQVAVTSSRKASGGVTWWLLELGGEYSRQGAVTQTIKVTLEPQMLDEHGQVLPFLIDAPDDAEPGSSPSRGALDAPG